MIWSFNLNDPQNDNDDNVIYHTARGSASLNLLGGNPNQQAVGNQSYLDITVSDVSNVMISISFTKGCFS